MSETKTKQTESANKESKKPTISAKPGKGKAPVNTGPIAYYKITATCACGASFETGSTLSAIRVDICSNCHPFFTGAKRTSVSEGRVEKFMKKYNKTAKQ